jgi:biofilm PGA synthesis protein PgaD
MKESLRVISRPQSQPRVRRTLYGMATLAIWMAYVYLWLPLITLFAWLVGLRTTYLEVYLSQHRIDPALLLLLPTIALCCALLLIGWAEYNRRRFGQLDRREPQDDVSNVEVAGALGATTGLAIQLRDSNRCVLKMDAHGRPLGVNPGFDANPRPIDRRQPGSRWIPVEA